MDRDLKCETCDYPYDLENRSPICIPCGHTICLSCLKQNFEKEGKIKCSSDNKIFNLRPEQYAKNHYILKLLQSKKTVITNININKNINLVNNNNFSLATSSSASTNNNNNNYSSNRSENVSNVSFLKDEGKINSFNRGNIVGVCNANVKKATGTSLNLKMQNSGEVKVFPKNKIPDIPIDNAKTPKRNNYLLMKTQSVLNKQENESEKILSENNNKKPFNNIALDSSRPLVCRNSLQEKDSSDNIFKGGLFTEPSESARNFSHSKQIVIKKIRKIQKKISAAAFEDEKLLVSKNTRFQIYANFKINNKNCASEIAYCRKWCCSNDNNEINFNYNNNYNYSEHNTSIGYSDYSKNENRELNLELKTLNNFLHKNLGEEILIKDKTGIRNNSESRINELKTSRRVSNENLKESLIRNLSEIENIKKIIKESKNQTKQEKDQNYESFLIIPDAEEDSIHISESDILCINPNNYNSNVFFDNINAPVEKTKLHKASKKLSSISSTLEVLDEYPNLKKIEKSELKKITKLSKNENENKKSIINQNLNLNLNTNKYNIEEEKNTQNNLNLKSNLNFSTENKQIQIEKRKNFHSNTLAENITFNKLFYENNNNNNNNLTTEKDEFRLHTHLNSDSKQFNNSYLSNENFNFNLIESPSAKELKKFESRVKNNDSPPIIFGYANILKNVFSKVNEINVLEFYPNFDFFYAEIISAINIFLKASVLLLLVLFNLFLFKCDFFLRFNMYLVLINDTKSVIEKSEIALIIANIKRWFAFISVVILDELIKFLYLPDLVLNVWTCLMTIYLLLISGPESGVQFIIVSIYKFLRKFNLFY